MNAAPNTRPADFLPVPAVQSVSRPWPDPLDRHALLGLAGEVVDTLAPHTESDPAALLFQFNTAFGNAVGPGPHFMQERTPHAAREYVAIVGRSAKARKGTSWDNIVAVFHHADPNWLGKCRASGLGSGEGLVNRVRDAEEGNAAPPPDRRLLVVETELSSVLSVSGREGNTLSEVLRNAWDSGALFVTTRNAPLRATGTHVSVIGHITIDELQERLSRTGCHNGFANRFNWVCARRSQLLPDGGALADDTLQRLGLRVGRALAEARRVSRMTRSQEARSRWCSMYGELTAERPGRFGAITSRAEAHVLRWSIIYALQAGSSVIESPHLEAALACWKYAEQSARFIWGDPRFEGVSGRIFTALSQAGTRGLRRTDLNVALGGNSTSAEIDHALAQLQSNGLIARLPCPAGRGRPAEVWAVASEKTEEGRPLPSVSPPTLSL